MSGTTRQAQRHARTHRLNMLTKLRPRTAAQLHRFVEVMLDLRMPRKALVKGNDAPFDYLAHSFLEPAAGDVVVWANRGGGKTMLGAVATLLDLVFKPGIEICILGGSFEQSSRMYGYLRSLFDRPAFRGVLAGDPTQRRIELVNGSVATVLTQSPRSVRGQRVQKIRCDEVDLFDRQVWQAVQMVTRSKQCGETFVQGAIDVTSTYHRPFGLMGEVIEHARQGSEGKHDSAKLLRWCALDVIEKCPPQRDCEQCLLWNDCQGRAKFADGFMHIDDLIAQRQRTDDATWSAEMMCRRPTTSDSVYAMFDPAPGGKHVMPVGPGQLKQELVASVKSISQVWPEERPLRQVLIESGSRQDDPSHQLVGGMDFGIRNPLVMLWARLKPGEFIDGRDPNNVHHQIIEIVDEHVEEGLTLDQNLVHIERQGWPKPAWLGVDPAGGQRSSQTGRSEIDLLRRRGYRIRAKRSSVIEGIKRVRRRLEQGTLRIAPHCEHLIRSLAGYHFDPDKPRSESPVKDGHDHACDALRYLVVNLETGSGTVDERDYMG